MELIDYPNSLVLSCLQMLHGPKLIRGTDADNFDISTPPRSLQITTAGEYYRTHLFRTADYLGNAVLDVSLEHRELRRELDRDQIALREAAFGKGIPFSIKLDSLLEYAEEVSDREWTEVNLLTKPRPSRRLRGLADQLLRGGLMTADLVDALKEVLERSQSTRSVLVKRNLDVFALRVEALDHRLKHVFAKRLREIGNRGRRALRATDEPAVVVNLGHVEITASEFGDDLVPQAIVRDISADALTIVNITGSAGGVGFSRTALARPVQTSEGDIGQHGVMARLGPVLNCSVSELTNVEVATSGFLRKERSVFLLAPEHTSNNIELKLYQWTPGSDDVEEVQLGRRVRSDYLRDQVLHWMDRVNGECGTGKLSRRTIETVGTQLGRLVMDQ